jgi:hypothetical protein
MARTACGNTYSDIQWSVGSHQNQMQACIAFRYIPVLLFHLLQCTIDEDTTSLQHYLQIEETIEDSSSQTC